MHQDRARSVCITDFGLVISGPGSRDGRITVWGSHLAIDWSKSTKPEEETKDVSICEVDGFEMVCKKETVKFNLEHNETRYITKSATY